MGLMGYMCSVATHLPHRTDIIITILVIFRFYRTFLKCSHIFYDLKISATASCKASGLELKKRILLRRLFVRKLISEIFA